MLFWGYKQEGAYAKADLLSHCGAFYRADVPCWVSNEVASSMISFSEQETLRQDRDNGSSTAAPTAVFSQQVLLLD